MTYITPTWRNKFHINPARRLCTHARCLLCGGVMMMGGWGGYRMWWNSHDHQQRRTQSWRVKELLSSKWYICKKKRRKKHVHLRRNVYFQKAPLASSRSPSKILASPKRSASVPHHRGESAELKDGVYCFWRNLRARSRFLPPLSFWSAISVYLSAGFRVYVGEYSNRTPLRFCMK